MVYICTLLPVLLLLCSQLLIILVSRRAGLLMVLKSTLAGEMVRLTHGMYASLV